MGETWLGLMPADKRALALADAYDSDPYALVRGLVTIVAEAIKDAEAHARAERQAELNGMMAMNGELVDRVEMLMAENARLRALVHEDDGR